MRSTKYFLEMDYLVKNEKSSNLSDEFELFKNKFGKKYASEVEEAYRMAVFS